MADRLEERRAPVQGYAAGIPWDMHLRAYDVYCKRYGKQQELIEGWCRGGFGTNELDMFIPGWREELDERTKLRKRIEDLEVIIEAGRRREGELREELRQLRALMRKGCEQCNGTGRYLTREQTERGWC